MFDVIIPTYNFSLSSSKFPKVTFYRFGANASLARESAEGGWGYMYILTLSLTNINSQFDTGTKKSEPDIVFIA